ncbi:MAG: hypothetical protein JJU21_06365 [Salinarimonas sp.]|nr:hypothetical protein [Salinarimonas sp.]
MILEFIAAIAVGLAVGGIVHLLRRGSPGRIAPWAVPAAAGAAMIGFAVYMEYTWAGRTIDALPDEAVVASQNAVNSWYRPWTYLFPLTNRMIVVDHRFTRRNEAHPDHVLTGVVMLGRFEPGRQIPVVFDCAEGRRAELDAQVSFSDDGALEGADWRPLAADDPILRAACGST